MSKDILSETFQKHLKLLHKHLNINEAYGDAAHLDYVKNRQTDRRVDWDPDGVTGTRYDEPYREPKTIADYAKEVGWSDSMIKTYIYWLNNIWKDSRGGWHRGSPYNNMDSYEFHQWMKDEKLATQAKKHAELSNEVKNVSDKLKTPMSSLIQTLGTIGWQKYKRLDNKRKIARLLLLALIPDNKQKLKAELGSNYDELLNRLKNADYKKDVQDVKILTLAIEKAEKMLGRGFFEQ
jgi:flagellin-specific chaperone FliS